MNPGLPKTDRSVLVARHLQDDFQFHNLFHRLAVSNGHWRKLKALRDLPRHFYSVRCRGIDYSSGSVPPSASDSNLVLFFRNAILTLPMGPFLCLAIMISALPCNSGSSCL